MRGYLLGRSGHIKPYRFNLFFTPAGVTSSARLPEGMSWYSLRGADLTPVYSATRFATYVKLPGMFFWTSIVPPDPGGWRGTKIGRQGQFRSSNQILEEPGVFDFMLHRIETVYSKISNLSDAQRAKIDSAVLKNPVRAANSHSLEVWMDDERIRAENAAKPTV